MIYITGDKHADFNEVFDFCHIYKTTLNDVLIVLGDAGINYFADERDYFLKNSLLQCPITFFCIHGNHEERPENIKQYKTKHFHEGIVYYEVDYPNILFAKDGEIYNINGRFVLVIGGAYSVDKYYRLSYGLKWYESEQPNKETKNRVKNVLSKYDNKIDVILSHTCPYSYLPREVFLTGLEQSTVDNSTELFLDEVEKNTTYELWYCGHFHIDKRIDKIRFMFHDIEEFK